MSICTVRKPVLELAVLLMFFLILVAESYGASDDFGLVNSKLENLSNAPDTLQNQQLKEIWQESKQLLTDWHEFEVKARGYTDRLENYPRELDRLEQNIPLKSLPKIRLSKSDSLERMEQQQVMVKVALLELNSLKQQFEIQIESLRKRSSLLPSLLTEANAALMGLNNPMVAEASDDSVLQEAVKVRQEYRRQMLIAKIKMLEFESLLLPKQLNMAMRSASLLMPRIDQYQSLSESLADWIKLKKTDRSERALEKSLQMTNEGLPNHPGLMQLAEDNQALVKEVEQHSGRIEEVKSQRGFLLAITERLDKNKNALQKRLELQGRDDFLGTEIRRQLKNLPERVNTQATELALNQARLLQFSLEQQKDDIASPKRYFQEWLQSISIENNRSESLQSSFSGLIKARDRLIEQVLPVVYAYIKELESYLLLQNEFNDKHDQFITLLRENLLLTLSAKPVSRAFIDDLGHALLNSMATIKGPSLKAFLNGIWPQLLWLLILLAGLLGGGAKLWRTYHLPWRRQAQQAMGKVHQDRFSYPLLMALAVLVKALAWAIPFLSLRWLVMSLQPTPLTAAVVFMLQVLAQAVFLWVFLRQVLASDGIIAGQFKCPEMLLTKMRRGINRYGPALIVLSALIAFTDVWPDETLGNTLGRLAFITSCLCIASFAWEWLTVNPKLREMYQTHHLPWFKHPRFWAGLIFLEQLYMIVVALQGYYLAALFQKVLVIKSVFWLMLCVLGFYLIYRGLLITQRRLAYSQAMARRNELRQAWADGSGTVFSELDLTDDNYADISAISRQSAALLRIVIWLALLGGLGMIWLDVLPALSFLDKVVLWSWTDSTEPGAGIHFVTLRTFLVASAILTLVVVATHNLPGALELLVLRNLKLNTGTGYAVTSLLKYSIMIIGVAVTFQQLGLEWSKLQWLLAALSVGLGFGLQEIVANFVSGLIILFERPIRIGDVITLGNIDGVVSRIHIRATTLIDFNRKEVVVPNKTFITEQLTNWSLNDYVTRLQFPVGVAYGSDCQKALAVLVEVAQAHPKVMRDPEPYALFMAFANSALNLELRVYVDDIDARLGIMNDLNLAINQRFLQEGIVIAFPQLDVHIKQEIQ